MGIEAKNILAAFEKNDFKDAAARAEKSEYFSDFKKSVETGYLLGVGVLLFTLIGVAEDKLSNVDALIEDLKNFGLKIRLKNVAIGWFVHTGTSYSAKLDAGTLSKLEMGLLAFADLPSVVDATTASNESLGGGSWGHVKKTRIRFRFQPLKYTEFVMGNKSSLTPIIKYYRLTIPGSNLSNASSVLYATNPEYGPYTGVEARYMCEADFTTPTTDLITFESKRIPNNDVLGIPDTFLETLYILSEPYQTADSSNMIVAVADYEDSGSGIATNVPSVNYKVTAASGMYEGYTNVQIDYSDKSGFKKRKVIIT